MSKRSINEVLAENLKHYMGAQGLKQKALGEQAGMAQTTVSLYLNPGRRQPSKSGKVPSANLGDVERLAAALEVEVWELLRPLSGPEREAYDKIANAYKALQGSDADAKPVAGSYKPKEPIEPHHPAMVEPQEHQKVV
jgi:transcriptional regulator with XRE-family HTH domain